MMQRTIIYKKKVILLSLYKTLVCPLVEYCTAAWSPLYYQKDKILLEPGASCKKVIWGAPERERRGKGGTPFPLLSLSLSLEVGPLIVARESGGAL